MSLIVRWTRRALKRLDEIGNYIARDNPSAATRTVGEIAGGVNTLGKQPALGRPGRLVGTRELVIAGTNYIVAYRVNNRDVEILTILHGAQQWPEQL